MFHAQVFAADWTVAGAGKVQVQHLWLEKDIYLAYTYRLYNEVEVYTWFYTPKAAGPEVYKPRIDRTEVYN